MFGIAFEGVPVFTGHEVEEAQIRGNLSGVPAFPRTAINQFRHERAKILAVLQDQLTGFDTGHHAVHPHVAAALSLMHAGVDIQCSKQRIERAEDACIMKALFSRLCGT